MLPKMALKLDGYLDFVAHMGWTTQVEEAAALGISEPTISRIRSGKTPVSARFAAALLAVAEPNGFDFNQLFTVQRTIPAEAAA